MTVTFGLYVGSVIHWVSTAKRNYEEKLNFQGICIVLGNFISFMC